MILIFKRMLMGRLHSYYWNEDEFKIMIYAQYYQVDSKVKNLEGVIEKNDILNFLDGIINDFSKYTYISDGNPYKRIVSLRRDIILKLVLNED